jgi:drug/metabolite transporter (DMT)-like permease
LPPSPPPERARNPRLGYGLAALAAALWALNGSLARFLLDDGVGAMRLAQLRSLLSWAILVACLALLRPQLLRIHREDVPRLAFLGIAGLALVHATYFVAIDHLQIGVALVIQYLGPLLVLLWLRFYYGRRLRPSLWFAAALSLAGCFLVVEAWDVGALDTVGLLAAFAAAVTFAIYLVSSERSGHTYTPFTTLAWAFGFASLFWALAQPLWDFPVGEFSSARNILLGLGVAVVGTLLPFILMVEALRHIPASRAAVVATLEPVLAAIIAWIVHGEVLEAVQIAGGMLVVVAVVWVQSQRPSLESEALPAHRPRRGEPPQAARAPGR